MKKILILFFLTLLFFSFANNSALAEGACPKYPEDGLVPCGTDACPCTLCHLFVLVNNLVNFLLFRIVPVIGAVMIVIGGFMLMFAYVGQGGSETLNSAKKVFISTLVGILIIYCAWGIVNVFLYALGVTKFTGEWKDGGFWWEINCK